MYQIVHEQGLYILIESFQSSVAPQHNYNCVTQSSSSYLPEPKTEYMGKSISYSGAKLLK